MGASKLRKEKKKWKKGGAPNKQRKIEMSKKWGRKTLKYKKWEWYRRKQTATKVKEGHKAQKGKQNNTERKGGEIIRMVKYKLSWKVRQNWERKKKNRKKGGRQINKGK